MALCLFQLVSNPLGWSGSDVPDESVLNYVGIWATGCVHFVYIIVFYKWFCKRTVDSTVEDMRKHLAKKQDGQMCILQEMICQRIVFAKF